MGSILAQNTMKNLRILFLKTNSNKSKELGDMLVENLQAINNYSITVEIRASEELDLLQLFKIISNYDIHIFDGTIERSNEDKGLNYDFIDPILYWHESFFIVSRNTIPMNLVPPKCNISRLDSLRNNMYHVDGNKIETVNNADAISNEEIVDWIKQELIDFIARNPDFQRPQSPVSYVINTINDIELINKVHDKPKKNQIFLSFRGKYQTRKYHDYNVNDVKDEIKQYHNFSSEWDEPFSYGSASLTEEFMPEQRIWTVQSIISSKIRECKEFWIFETLQERDENNHIIHYSYWDSWWCIAEVMEILQLYTRGSLDNDFKLMVFNPCRKEKIHSIPLSSLPRLTEFEERELSRLRNEGDIKLNNLRLREDKRRFRDASFFMKIIRFAVLKIQWRRLSRIKKEVFSITFKQYVEDVNCRAYEDSFLTRRIYMDSESMETGKTQENVLKEGFCKHFLNLCGTYDDTTQFEGVFTLDTTNEELIQCAKHHLPVIAKRTEKDKTIEKSFYIKEYGFMYFFWLPLHQERCYLPKMYRRTGPNKTTIQEIPLFKVEI